MIYQLYKRRLFSWSFPKLVSCSLQSHLHLNLGEDHFITLFVYKLNKSNNRNMSRVRLLIIDADAIVPEEFQRYTWASCFTISPHTEFLIDCNQTEHL